MSLSRIYLLLAQTPPQQNPGDILRTMGPMIIIMAAFFLIMHFSQQKKIKQHDELLKSLKPGDKVLTNGGIIGVVVGVKDKSVSIRSADNKLEVLKSAVTEITEKSSGAGES